MVLIRTREFMQMEILVLIKFKSIFNLHISPSLVIFNVCAGTKKLKTKYKRVVLFAYFIYEKASEYSVAIELLFFVFDIFSCRTSSGSSVKF